MYIVTGGLGFIGSNLVKRLQHRNQEKLIIVDIDNKGELSQAARILLKDHEFVSNEDLLKKLSAGDFKDCKGVFHNGACTDTTEWNGEKMMRLNYNYSKDLLDLCLSARMPLVYASSGAIYGASQTNNDNLQDRYLPLNVYGFSKSLFDEYVYRVLLKKVDVKISRVVGLRYFNVFGPGEDHKGKMASVIWHFSQQLKDSEELRLFEGSHGYQAGQQLRDFIFIDDIVDLNLWAMECCDVSDIYNAGTGVARTFNDVAEVIINFYGRGRKTYIPFPDNLMSYYQSYTCAQLDKLRLAGYKSDFTSLESGIKKYLTSMESKNNQLK
jgi:ADP-L-glycero-D-manno-heptose 6-epimerase